MGSSIHFCEKMVHILFRLPSTYLCHSIGGSLLLQSRRPGITGTIGQKFLVWGKQGSRHENSCTTTTLPGFSTHAHVRLVNGSISWSLVSAVWTTKILTSNASVICAKKSKSNNFCVCRKNLLSPIVRKKFYVLSTINFHWYTPIFHARSTLTISVCQSFARTVTVSIPAESRLISGTLANQSSTSQ